MGTSDVEVLVIGAGAMGSATAWWLARRGVDVALVEQFEQGHVRGSSHGGSRIFRLAYSEPHYVALALEAFDLWREVESDTGEVLLELTGGIDHGPAGSEVSLVADALERAGRVVERLSADAAQERWPGLRFDELVVHSSDTGRLLADRCVAALQRRCALLGASVRFGCPVARLDAARRAVELADGTEMRASRALVVTAGAWVTKVLGDDLAAGVLPPITVTREQTFHFPPVAAAVGAWPVFIHYRPPVAMYGLETPGEGVKVAEHGSGTAVDPDARSFDVDPVGRQRVVSYVADWLPGLQPSPVSESTCLYTNTPDSSFVLARRGDVVVGSACSGHGFKFTPAIGKRLADLALS